MKTYSVYNPSSYLGEKVYAALDLGTTSCRLLVAKNFEHHFKILNVFSKITRLGEGLSSQNELSEEAIKRTLEALEECALRLKEFPLYKTRFFATEACRKAKNSALFLDSIKQRTNLSLEIISSKEEARLCMWACSDLFDRSKKKTLIIDTGGGSTDFSLINQEGEIPFIEDSISVPYGVIMLSELTPPSLKDFIFDIFKKALFDFDRHNNLSKLLYENEVQTIGMSGTVTTLAAFFLNLKYYSHFKVDGLRLNRKDLLLISKNLQNMSLEEKQAHSCIGAQRASLTTAGCLIIDALLELYPIETMVACDRGLREGALFDMIRKDTLDAVKSTQS
ncbi:MAG: Ppx/GppA family phosphatase [Alphaproteobacteria bacterium]|nr:Ppx/GppA family phosphatase [Alphaproteobacteria bacterium]